MVVTLVDVDSSSTVCFGLVNQSPAAVGRFGFVTSQLTVKNASALFVNLVSGVDLVTQLCDADRAVPVGRRLPAVCGAVVH